MDVRTLDDIYQSYVNDVYRYLLSLCFDHYLAEDLVQETFFRAYLHFETIEPERLKPWLFRVAYHAFIDEKRKGKRIVLTGTSYFERDDGHETPEQVAVVREQLRDVERWMTALPEKQRHALVLTDFHQLSYQEAAEVMGVTLAHFKVLLFRARQALRQQRDKEETHDG